MFAVLTVEMEENLPARRRAALRLRPAKGLTWREDLFRMAMFCHAKVTLCAGWREDIHKKRVGEALLQLKARGARQVVLPRKWQDLARTVDLVPVNCRPALEACGVQAVLEACRGLDIPAGEACLAVYGTRLSSVASMQLLTLAKSLRTLRIYGEGNEALRNQLWRGCGIVDRGPMPENAPVLALLLTGGKAPGQAQLTVDLSDGAGEGEGLLWTPQLVLPQGAQAKLPEGASPVAFAAALLQMGALQPREIHVSRLDIPGTTQYNKEIVENCF
jgi:hypothetical protein